MIYDKPNKTVLLEKGYYHGVFVVVAEFQIIIMVSI